MEQAGIVTKGRGWGHPMHFILIFKRELRDSFVLGYSASGPLQQSVGT